MGSAKTKLTGHTDIVNFVTQLNNGYIVSCSNDKSIKVWTQKSNCYTLLKTINQHTKGVITIFETLDFNLISLGLDFKLYKFNPSKDYEVIGNLDLKEEYSILLQLPNTILIMASVYGNLALLNEKDLSEIEIIKAHKAFINSMKMLNDKSYLITVSSDFTVKIWRIGLKFELFQTITDHKSPVKALHILSDNTFYTGDDFCQINHYRICHGKIIDNVDLIVNYNLESQYGITKIFEYDNKIGIVNGIYITYCKVSDNKLKVLKKVCPNNYINYVLVLKSDELIVLHSSKNIFIWK